MPKPKLTGKIGLKKQVKLIKPFKPQIPAVKPEKPANILLLFIFLRYSIVSLLVLMDVFSFFLPYLTIKASFYLINLISPAKLYENIISFQGYSVAIIPACVALSAYYLLLILNLSTPMQFKKRIFSLTYSFMLFFVINILRIAFFSFILTLSEDLFNTFHFAVWFAFSSLIVVLIWFSETELFDIYEVPGYSDIKFLIKAIRGKN